MKKSTRQLIHGLRQWRKHHQGTKTLSHPGVGLPRKKLAGILKRRQKSEPSKQMHRDMYR